MIGLDVGVEEAVAEAIRQACATGETTVTLTATLFPPKTEPTLLTIRPTARLLRQHRTGQPWVVFLMGTLLTGVVVAWLIQTERRHAHVARTVAKRTRELATANQSLGAETRRKAAPEARRPDS